MSVQKRALFLLLLLAVLLAAAGLWIHSRTPSSGTPYARITQDGTLLYEINLDTVETPYFLQITDEAGAYNQIEVSHGQIRMSQASCRTRSAFIPGGSKRMHCLSFVCQTGS